MAKRKLETDLLKVGEIQANTGDTIIVTGEKLAYDVDHGSFDGNELVTAEYVNTLVESLDTDPSNVLHKTGDETKSGSLTFDDELGVTTTISSLEVHVTSDDGTVDATMNAAGYAVTNITDMTAMSMASDFLMYQNNGLQAKLKIEDLTAAQTQTLQNDSGKVALTKTSQANTGALSYAGISVASTTQVNIGACEGYIVDNETDPFHPVITKVSYAGETNKTVPTLGSGIASYVLLDDTGTIVFQNTFPTSSQRKTHIYLSKIGHPTGTINTAGNEVDFITSPLQQFRDLFQAFNYVNQGIFPFANGANLNLSTSSGTVTGNGINFVADPTNPNNLPVTGAAITNFLYRTQTGAGGGAVSVVDPTTYDVGGVSTAIGGASSRSTIQYFWLVPGLGYIMLKGQTVYSNLTDAIAAIGKESSFVIYPSLIRNAILIGGIAMRRDTTALNDSSKAFVFKADILGQLMGASAGVSVATLQTAYNNSLTPEITTSTTLGAFSVKRGSAADTDTIFEGLNAAGTTNFSITGEGSSYAAKSQHVGGFGLEETFVSPQITGHQGYTTDGTSHYIIDTARLDKRNNDGSWSIASSNLTPFAGVAGVAHLGDWDYYSGVLYAPAKTASGCSPASIATVKVITYNSTTLALINQFDITASGHEATGIAIDGPNNLAYIVSFCDGSKVWKYNATTFALIGTISLSRTLSRIQGISYYNNKLYISSEDDGLLVHDLATSELTLLKSPLASYTTMEGLKVVSGQIRCLVDTTGGGTASYVRFFDATTDAQGFYTDVTGETYATGRLRVDNVLSVFTDTNNKGSINTATKLGRSSALYMESGDPANSAPMIGTIGHDITHTFLSRNAEYFGGSWLRSDVAKTSSLYAQNATQHEWRTATAGANPITWNTRMALTTAGALTLTGGLFTSTSSAGLFSGVGTSANNALFTLRNTTTTEGTSAIFFDDTNTKSVAVGVLNSATTLGVSYGVAGEAYMRSGAASNGLHFAATAGAIRFSVNAGQEAMRIFLNKNVVISSAVDDGVNRLQVNGSVKALNYRVAAMETAPALSTSTGTLGEIRWTATHVYLCTATNTWVRAALATF